MNSYSAFAVKASSGGGQGVGGIGWLFWCRGFLPLMCAQDFAPESGVNSDHPKLGS